MGVEYQGRKTVRLTSLSLYEGDYKLLLWLCSYLGCSKSEAVRTAIRSMAASLQQVDKRVNF